MRSLATGSQRETGAPLRVFLLLSTIWSGLVVTEQISSNVLPLTLHRFTSSAGLIGLILSIEAWFVFSVQPLAGIISDRIWTPLGRRAILLVTGAPIVAACLWLVPEARILWQVIVLVVIYQFVQNILWGSDNPLIADLVPPRQRTLAMGCMIASAQGSSFLFLRYGMGLLMEEYGERSAYRLATLAQIVLVAGAALLIREKKDIARPQRPKLTLRRYAADMLGDPVLRRIGALGFIQSFFLYLVTGFVVLFALQSVGLSRREFGDAMGWQSFLMLCLAVPAGLVVEKFHKGRVLTTAYLVGAAGAALGYIVHGYALFFVVALAVGLYRILINVTQSAYFTECAPADIIGQLSGAYNICLGSGRCLAFVAGGWLVVWAGGDYRVLWLVGMAIALAGAWVAASLPDRRHEARLRRTQTSGGGS